MITKNQISLIDGEYHLDKIIETVADTSGVIIKEIESSVIYPYFSFNVSSLINTLVGQKSISFICLVDACNGLGVTAENFSVKELVIENKELLEIKIDQINAKEIAIKTSNHHLSKCFRTITSFNVNCDLDGIVYKRFWIADAGDKRLMIDSITCGWYPLKRSAAL